MDVSEYTYILCGLVHNNNNTATTTTTTKRGIMMPTSVIALLSTILCSHYRNSSVTMAIKPHNTQMYEYGVSS